MVLFHNRESLLSKDLKILAILIIFLFLLTACGGGGGSNPESTDVLPDAQGLPDIPGGWVSMSEPERTLVHDFKEYLGGAEFLSAAVRQSYLRTTLGTNLVDCSAAECTMSLPDGRYESFNYFLYDPSFIWQPQPRTMDNVNYRRDLRTGINEKIAVNPVCSMKKKALIIAPFSWEVNEKNLVDHYELMKSDLEEKGYKVDLIKNENADLAAFEKVKDDSYSIVIISTHGNAKGGIVTGQKAPLFSKKPKDFHRYFTAWRMVNKSATRFLGIRANWWKDVNIKNRYFSLEACSALSEKSELNTIIINNKPGFFHGYTSDTIYPLFMFLELSVLNEAASLDGNSISTVKAYYKGLDLFKKETIDSYPDYSEEVSAVHRNSSQSSDVNFSIDPDICSTADEKKPDLVVTAVSNIPSTAQPGNIITPKVTVENQGNADAGRFSIGYYLSTDSTITTSDNRIPGCRYKSGRAAGESRTCNVKTTLPSDLSPGTYYFGAVADYKSQVLESDESNNSRASDNTITIQNKNPSSPPTDDKATLVFPQESQYINSGGVESLTFQWTGVKGATGYSLGYSWEGVSFLVHQTVSSSKAGCYANSSNCSLTVDFPPYSHLLSGTTQYEWKVRAGDGEEWGPWSDEGTFSWSLN